MSQYIKIIGPLARSLWSLESPHSNASDVFVHWLAIGASLKEVFSTDSVEELGIPRPVVKAITGIFNTRWKAFIDEAPSDIYFTTFYLDPRKFSFHVVLVLLSPVQDILVPTY